jgi:peptidoglycan/LPS O-acetylase OafA/YrhL
MEVSVDATASKMRAKINDIEMLRAVAISIVLVAHLPALIGWHGVQITHIQQYLAFGSGVDLFFVISGFVICRSFILHHSGTIPTDFKPAATAFWIRRAFRILPAAWFWIAVSLLGAIALNDHGNFGKLGPDAWDGITAFFYVSNFNLWACYSGVLRWCANGGIPNGIYWTLSLEEQFYLLFPVLMILTPRRMLVPALLTLAVATIFMPMNTFTYWFRCSGLFIGVLLGLASFHPAYARLNPIFLDRPWRKLAASGLLLLAILVVPSPELGLPFGHGLLALTCGLWVFIASYDRGYVLPKSRVTPLLLWIGSRSYSLYLTHMLAFCSTRELWASLGKASSDASGDVPYLVYGALILWLFAEGSYRYIERPFMRRGARFLERRRFAVAPLPAPQVSL